MTTTDPKLIEPVADFRREWRYIVVKRCRITAEQEIELLDLINRIGGGVEDCAVIENDWPEYETVWKMIEARVRGEDYAAAAINEAVQKERAEVFNSLWPALVKLQGFRSVAKGSGRDGKVWQSLHDATDALFALAQRTRPPAIEARKEGEP